MRPLSPVSAALVPLCFPRLSQKPLTETFLCFLVLHAPVLPLKHFVRFLRIFLHNSDQKVKPPHQPLAAQQYREQPQTEFQP
uniref:Uncharacterized protein n=1 Tax=uncultured marine virus TaxID=186617 RepID=A0A0F7L0T7_9VIRU|nr:hypothetical protein [uncultured marine virus]